VRPNDVAQMAEADPLGEPGRHLNPGQRVEVRSRFDRGWAQGFEVQAAEPDGYAVRRLSDGAVLPIRFRRDDLRRERTNSFWWY
jgi:hypothetical protein